MHLKSDEAKILILSEKIYHLKFDKIYMNKPSLILKNKTKVFKKVLIKTILLILIQYPSPTTVVLRKSIFLVFFLRTYI